MRIALLESYYGGSHKAWADGYQRHSRHDIDLLALPARFWKWRMQGAAISFARMLQTQPDLILASSMINLATFRALTYRRLGDAPLALYLHENQLSYPQNQRQGHGWRYGFINYISALTADAVYFNSDYHRADFMAQLPRLLKHFADYNELASLETIRHKSQTLPLGLDLRRFDAHHANKPADAPARILWNHRWEADKNPDAFARSLIQLAQSGCDFQAVILGERFGEMPAAFRAAREQLGERIIQFGYAQSFADYARWLWQCDYVVSAAWQEFFGAAVCEAMYCRCIPILPDRLNYPHLLPAEFRSQCLYARDKLTAQLAHHLAGEASAETDRLRAAAARYDWSRMAGRYDEELAALASRLASG
ncbi:MAG: DUF3524 domain-containing protein [Chloroflexi bacterium]|nr:DUF3524 domain-containing protein [Chloroflexota bacterium]MCY4246932.1 DUF3524 domain-containing protein [Chloroflexota bacterium]